MKNLCKSFSGLLLLVAFFALCAGASSCSDDKKNDEPSAVVGTLSVVNNSRYTLEQFQVNFMNDDLEVITTEPKGTLKPGGSVEVEIPIGATKYYMGTVMAGSRYWSANYLVSVRRQVLTDDIVGLWSK